MGGPIAAILPPRHSPAGPAWPTGSPPPPPDRTQEQDPRARCCKLHPQFASVAEPADAPGLGPGGATHGGSNPPARTPPEQGRSPLRVPYEFSDRPTLEHALLAIAPVSGIAPALAEPVVRRTVEAAAEVYRRPDGSYRFENRSGT
jgi:hypothetical protein